MNSQQSQQWFYGAKYQKEKDAVKGEVKFSDGSASV